MPLVFPQQKFQNEVKTQVTSNSEREGSKKVNNRYFPGGVLALTQRLILLYSHKAPISKHNFYIELYEAILSQDPFEKKPS